MASSPVINTPRLRIEPFSERFLTERYVGWLNDPKTTEFSDQRFRRHTLASCLEYFESFRDSPNYFWAVVEIERQHGHIGNMNAYIDATHGTADIGIMIGEASARGRGYASEAWMGVCDFLFREAGLRKITAGALALNLPMLGVMARAGMSEDGRRVRQQIWNGQEVDVVYRALFRDEWLKRHPRQPFEKAAV